MSLSEDEIIKTLDSKIAEHEEIILRYKRALAALKGEGLALLKDEKINETSQDPKVKPSISNSTNNYIGTVRDILIGIFKSEDKPLTVKDLLTKYNSKTGKDASYNSFSGQFSALMTKQGLFKKHVIMSNPIERRYYYGLPQWFEGEFLNEEYSKKIEAA